MRMLVTGGAGFIGSHVVDALLRQGHQVTVLDNFDPFYPRALKEDNIRPHRLRSAWRLVEVDLRERQHLQRALSGSTFDVIVHLAAKVGVLPSVEDPVAYQDVNVRGTHHLLEFARERGIRRFVFASSSSVYGVNPRVPWREDDALQPISPYASTKISAELLGHVYAHLFGVRFVAVRLFTVYGPRQRPDLAIHKFARRIQAGESIPVYGAGDTRRDYTFVEDVVDGILRAIDYEASVFDVINLGNNQPITLRELIAHLETALGKPAQIEWLPAQAGDAPQTWADISKANRLLGYAPKTTYPEGIGRFVSWMRESFQVRST